MFGINNKYVAEFNLTDKKNFISQEDLFDFTIIEQAGNTLPVFRLAFRTTDDDLPLYINEGTELNVSLGQNTNNLDKYSLIFQNSESFKGGNNRHYIVATGTYNKLEYLNTDILITDKMNNANALEMIGGKFFTIDSNLDKSSSDLMYHKQYGNSHKRFINDLWLSTYIPDSFLAVGITSEGKMLLRDIKKMLSKSEPDWNLSNPNDEDKFLPISPKYKLKSKKGFFNSLVGVGRQKFIYDQDDAIGIIQNEEIKAFLALSQKLMVNANREKKSFENGIINENVHANYHRAYLRNVMSLANYSSITLNYNFMNIYKKLRLYDTVFFKELSTDGIKSTEYSSGKYITTKVVRRLNQRSLITLSSACRESFNQPKGNLK